jgi:gluconolactonase
MTDLAELIDPAATLARIGSGYEFTEGPVWDPRQNWPALHDIPGDIRWRWTRAGGMEVDLAPTFKGNGMAFDNDGHLLVCEQVSSCLVRFRDGKRELVAHHYKGTYLNSPNDVVTRGLDGSIYFTDPDYGRWNDWIGQERNQNGVGYNALFRVPPGGGEIELVVAEDEFDHPMRACSTSTTRAISRSRSSTSLPTARSGPHA